MNDRQIGVISETHSTKRIADPYAQYLSGRGFQSFWNHENYQEGENRLSNGVCIIIRKSFLQKFHYQEQTNIWNGHITRTRLITLAGHTLDIYGCYFPARTRTQRREAMQRLQAALNPQAHSLIMGDFNFVIKGGDRFTFTGNQAGWQTEADPEALTWNRIFRRNSAISEIYQPRTTYQCTTRTSRLDRIYSSLRPEQLAAFNSKAWVIDKVVQH